VRLFTRFREGRRPLYANQGVGQLSHGLAAPFVPYYAARLGATTADLGWLQAFSNLFPNVLQMPWAWLSDRLGRRVPFLVLGGALSSLLFVFMAASVTPWQLILVVLIQAIAMSMVAPNWSALLGEKTGFRGRGRVFGSLSQVGGIAGLVGTLLAAWIVFQSPPTSASAFHIPFVLAAVVGILAAVVLVAVRESPRKSPRPAATHPEPLDVERHADFLYFVKAQSFYNFFMSLAWPLIPITVAIVLGASNLDIVMIAVVTALSTIVLQTQVGRLLDKVGPATLIQASRFLFVLVPLAYALARDLWVVYLISAVMGLPTAIVNIAFNAYILDVAPKAKHAEYFGLFNGAIGVVTFAGTVLGGYLARVLEGVLGNLWRGLFVVYMVSFAGRAAGAFLSLKIRDPTKYPESLDQVWQRFEHFLANGRH
jgi:MFS family permease